MKKYKLFLVIILVIFICGCGKTKVSLTSEQFVKKMNKINYSVSEVADLPDYANSAYVLNDTVYLYFVEGNKKYDIEGIFIDECKNALGEVSDDYKSKTDGGKNWAKMTLLDDEYYYYVIWVGKTYMYGKSRTKDKEVLEKIMTSLGY